MIFLLHQKSLLILQKVKGPPFLLNQCVHCQPLFNHTITLRMGSYIDPLVSVQLIWRQPTYPRMHLHYKTSPSTWMYFITKKAKTRNFYRIMHSYRSLTVRKPFTCRDATLSCSTNRLLQLVFTTIKFTMVLESTPCICHWNKIFDTLLLLTSTPN